MLRKCLAGCRDKIYFYSTVAHSYKRYIHTNKMKNYNKT